MQSGELEFGFPNENELDCIVIYFVSLMRQYVCMLQLAR